MTACTASPPREAPARLAVDDRWLQLSSADAFGEVSALDIDGHGHLFVLHRAGRPWVEPFPEAPIPQPTVHMFDAASGALLARWGAGEMVMPHGLSVDAEDAVWITDVAREQVLKFSHEGRLELALGVRGRAGTGAAGFGRPADVAFDGDRVLVADGYVNDRVAVFDRSGRYVEEWRGDGLLDLPHAIAADGGRVLVADREHGRVQVFAADGRPLERWEAPGRGHVYAVRPLPDGRVVTLEGRDRENRTGAILRVRSPRGDLLASYDVGLAGEKASLGHDLAAGPDGTLYMADHRGNRVVRFRLPETGER
ncbi:6-bladed beta-propeller [Erythrobacteraceae bacterium CFH 75059]|nr:6-bladed beta-propeller [Erythrobacteraceae bacterium CFH 75059]